MYSTSSWALNMKLVGPGSFFSQSYHPTVSASSSNPASLFPQAFQFLALWLLFLPRSCQSPLLPSCFLFPCQLSHPCPASYLFPYPTVLSSPSRTAPVQLEQSFLSSPTRLLQCFQATLSSPAILRNLFVEFYQSSSHAQYSFRTVLHYPPTPHIPPALTVCPHPPTSTIHPA
jgi:hypothetical protein